MNDNLEVLSMEELAELQDILSLPDGLTDPVIQAYDWLTRAQEMENEAWHAYLGHPEHTPEERQAAYLHQERTEKVRKAAQRRLRKVEGDLLTARHRFLERIADPKWDRVRENQLVRDLTAIHSEAFNG